MSYTPKPWILIKADAQNTIQDEQGNTIAIIQNIPDPVQSLANSNLISAAPELYEALLEAKNNLDKLTSNGVLADIDAALLKAERGM